MKKITVLLTGMILSMGAFASEPSKSGLCKGAIGLVMMKDPSIIEAQDQGKEVHVSYVRPADGSKFEMKCKFPKDGVIIWAGKIDGQWGRWRNKSSDSIVTYETSGDATTFRENMASKVVNEKTFDHSQL